MAMKKIIDFLKRGIDAVLSRTYSYITKNTLHSVGENFRVHKKIVIKNGNYITIGDNFVAMDGCRIEAWDEYAGVHFQPAIHIGNNVSMNMECHIGAINKITIGNNVLMGSRVFVTDHSHGNCSWEEAEIAPNKRALFSKGEVSIEDNVWLGEGAVVLPNVHIGRGAIVGANAVVTKDVPEYCIVGGVPARVLKDLHTCAASNRGIAD